MQNSSIISFACHLPEQSIHTSAFLDEAKSSRFDVSNTYISDDIGINTVRHADSELKPSELAAFAAEEALQKAGLKSDQLDHIFFTGLEGDFIEPSTAHQVQKLIGGKALCFDVKNACLGFMSAMYTANALIASGMAKYILVCTGEKNSEAKDKVISYLKKNQDESIFKNMIGFLTVSDSGGAVIMGNSGEGHELVGFKGASNGKQTHLCHYNYDNVTGDIVGQMLMAKICSMTINQHRGVFHSLLNDINWQPEDIDHLISHQVGAEPFRRISRKLGVDTKKMTMSYPKWGNLTTNTLAANLVKYENTFKRGQKVYFNMSGSGITVQHAGMIY